MCILSNSRLSFIMPTIPVKCRFKYNITNVAKIITFSCIALVALYYVILIIPAPLKRDNNVETDSSRRIFFHETSGRGSLNFKQCCTIESAAKHNPTRPVQLFMSAKSLDVSGTNGPWMDILKNHYSNVDVIQIDNDQFFKGTALQSWYEKGEWRQSRFRTAHLSDYIRLVSMYRHGGLYMDLDYVVLKPLDEKLLHNVLLVEGIDGQQLNNGVMHFEAKHRLVKELIDYLSKEYDPEDYYLHGPTALTDVYVRLCKTGTTGLGKCPDVSLLSYKHFCPIGPPFWHLYFEDASDLSLAMINSSYGVHLWNFLSAKEPVRMGTRQLYAILSQENCPVTAKRMAEFIST